MYHNMSTGERTDKLPKGVGKVYINLRMTVESKVIHNR